MAELMLLGEKKRGGFWERGERRDCELCRFFWSVLAFLLKHELLSPGPFRNKTHSGTTCEQASFSAQTPWLTLHGKWFAGAPASVVGIIPLGKPGTSTMSEQYLQLASVVGT